MPSRAPLWCRVLKGLAIGAASFVAFLVGGLLLLMWSCEPPSLNTLAGRFPTQRRDLETIVSMSDHDTELTRIDPTWLSSETAISQERWDEYRRLFSRNSITQGIERDPETRDAFFLVKSFGLLNRGTSSGYLYCGPGPKHSFEPCNSSQPQGEHPYKPGDMAYSYRRLADRWYAYSEGPG